MKKKIVLLAAIIMFVISVVVCVALDDANLEVKAILDKLVP